MVLQAFFDDSGSEPQSFAFILAGFVASQKQWEAFNDAWGKTLHLPPRLAYFKNNEAMGLKKQFDEKRGWTEQRRNDRLVELARVIKKHIPETFSVAMRHSDYERYIHGIPVERRMKTLENPYFLLFYEIMLFVGCVHSVGKEVVPCQFLFDEQGKVGERAAAWWPTFRAGLRTAGKFDLSPYFTESKPEFDRDTELRPPQAADLFVGQLGRAMASDTIIFPPSTALRLLWGGYHRVLDYRYLGRLRGTFIRMAEAIDAKKPERLKYALGRPTRKRTQKNKEV